MHPRRTYQENVRVDSASVVPTRGESLGGLVGESGEVGGGAETSM